MPSHGTDPDHWRNTQTGLVHKYTHTQTQTLIHAHKSANTDRQTDRHTHTNTQADKEKFEKRSVSLLDHKCLKIAGPVLSYTGLLPSVRPLN